MHLCVKSLCVCALIAMFVVFFSGSSAVADEWALVSTTGPETRSGYSMCYDDMRGKIVLFGGLGDYFMYYGDTWEWDGSSWTLVSSTGPTPRESAAMAYDSLNQRMILFGGMDANYNYLNDTWAWDGASWTQLTPTTSPSARYMHGMAYDYSRSQIVLYGGFDGDNISWSYETWTFDGAT